MNFGKGVDEDVPFKQSCTAIQRRLFEHLLCAGPALGTAPPPVGEGEPKNGECHRVKEEKGFSGRLLGLLMTSALFSVLYPPIPSLLLQGQPLAALCQDTDVKGHPSEAGQLGRRNGNLDLGLGSVLKALCVAWEQSRAFFKLLLLGIGSASRMLFLGSICLHLRMNIRFMPSS